MNFTWPAFLKWPAGVPQPNFLWPQFFWLLLLFLWLFFRQYWSLLVWLLFLLRLAYFLLAPRQWFLEQQW